MGKRIRNLSCYLTCCTRQATERVKRYVKSEDWALNLIDTGEFTDPDYRANPLNRCYYCKENLYRTICDHTSLPILSGTNLDDFFDFRPSLDAAKIFNVIHPFVEADIDKATIRRIARYRPR